MSSLVVSAIRRPNDIAVRFSTRSPEAGFGREAVGQDIYALTDRDLEVVRELDLPHGKRLQLAFDALAQVEAIDLEVFEQILWVVLGTVPSVRGSDLPPTLPTLTPSPPAKRTAAHPRGFRGTKYKPPKTARPKAIDLRPALCSRGATQDLLKEGWHLRHQVLTSVADGLGIAQETVDRWLAQATPPEHLFAGPWSSEPSNLDFASWDAVETLLWRARNENPRAVAELLALYDRLVQGDDALAASVTRLGALVPSARAVQWLVEAEKQPPELRMVFLSVVLESEVALRTEPSRHLLQSLASRAQASRYESWAWSLLEAQAEGVDPTYLEAGVRVLAEHRPDHYFHHVRDCEDYDEAVIERLLSNVPSNQVDDLAVSLWQSVGWLPQLMQHLRQIPADAMAPQPLAEYLYFLCDLGLQAEETPCEAERWLALERSLPAIQAMLSSVPPSFRSQASADLARIVEDWTEAWNIEDYLPRAIELFKRIQKPPLNPDGNFSDALRELLELETAEPDRLLSVPMACFARLDKACRRKNDGQLIGWGLSALGPYPELVIAGLETETALLARVAKILGAFNWQERERLLASWKPGGLLGEGIQDLSVFEIVDLLRASGQEGIVPKALREFLANQRPLTDRQVEGHRRRMIDRWPRVQLSSLHQHLVEEMGRAVGAARPDKDLQFALQLLADAGPSRRGLRRFLHQHLAGNESYLLDHPANRAWLRRRPTLDPILWTTGIQTEGRDDKGRAVTLTVEQNPFEILKLGTYVGSCLGIGGSYSWSAVSILLDINKQVVYARDSQGQFLARQVLAISSHLELVPFEVYPQVDGSMLNTFRAFDQNFAKALGLKINTDWECEVESIVARTWWNDYPWDELTPDSDGD